MVIKREDWLKVSIPLLEQNVPTPITTQLHPPLAESQRRETRLGVVSGERHISCLADNNGGLAVSGMHDKPFVCDYRNPKYAPHPSYCTVDSIHVQCGLSAHSCNSHACLWELPKLLCESAGSGGGGAGQSTQCGHVQGHCEDSHWQWGRGGRSQDHLEGRCRGTCLAATCPMHSFDASLCLAFRRCPYPLCCFAEYIGVWLWCRTASSAGWLKRRAPSTRMHCKCSRARSPSGSTPRSLRRSMAHQRLWMLCSKRPCPTAHRWVCPDPLLL